jgi:hypothetical protein
MPSQVVIEVQDDQQPVDHDVFGDVRATIDSSPSPGVAGKPNFPKT